MIAAFGADAARVFILFAAPVENELRWIETGIEGAVRFLRKIYLMVWRWHERLSDSSQRQDAPSAEKLSPRALALRRKTHQTIARVTNDFEHLHLNTSVAALMELFNELSDFNAQPATASVADLFVVREALESLTLMLAPFSPHMAEEIWERLGHTGGLIDRRGQGPKWPKANAELARKTELEIPIQVNGKLRSRVLASPEVTEDELRAAAVADEKVRPFTEGREVLKIIVVPQRLVNIVVR
jgi:leucyl-tRNA synthetase